MLHAPLTSTSRTMLFPSASCLSIWLRSVPYSFPGYTSSYSRKAFSLISCSKRCGVRKK